VAFRRVDVPSAVRYCEFPPLALARRLDQGRGRHSAGTPADAHADASAVAAPDAITHASADAAPAACAHARPDAHLVAAAVAAAGSRLAAAGSRLAAARSGLAVASPSPLPVVNGELAGNVGRVR
jgi:hypothetical protein